VRNQAVSLWRQDNFLIRVVAGAMIFYIHGRHKLEGWIAYRQHGTPWKLAESRRGRNSIVDALVAVLTGRSSF